MSIERPEPQFWYDIDGNPIDIAEAERLLGNPAEIIVADTQFGDRSVNTCHTVLDRALGRSLPFPLLFETALMSEPSPNRYVLASWLASTKAAALILHEQVCDAVRAGHRDPDDLYAVINGLD